MRTDPEERLRPVLVRKAFERNQSIQELEKAGAPSVRDKYGRPTHELLSDLVLRQHLAEGLSSKRRVVLSDAGGLVDVRTAVPPRLLVDEKRLAFPAAWHRHRLNDHVAN